MSLNIKICISCIFFILLSQHLKAQTQDSTQVNFPVNILIEETPPSSSEAFSAESFNATISPTASQGRPGLVKAGKIMTYIGVPLMVAGVLLARNSPTYQYECVNGNCQGSLSGALGANMFIHGTATAVSGIVLWKIGSKKR